MTVDLQYLSEAPVDASAYWTTYEAPINIILDNLMSRKNEKVEVIAKRLSLLHLQELICQEHAKCEGFNEDHCKVSWCPMRTTARRMIL